MTLEDMVRDEPEKWAKEIRRLTAENTHLRQAIVDQKEATSRSIQAHAKAIRAVKQKEAQTCAS